MAVQASKFEELPFSGFVKLIFKQSLELYFHGKA
jgi:hypothetical protein